MCVNGTTARRPRQVCGRSLRRSRIATASRPAGVWRPRRRAACTPCPARDRVGRPAVSARIARMSTPSGRAAPAVLKLSSQCRPYTVGSKCVRTSVARMKSHIESRRRYKKTHRSCARALVMRHRSQITRRARDLDARGHDGKLRAFTRMRRGGHSCSNCVPPSGDCIATVSTARPRSTTLPRRRCTPSRLYSKL